MTHMAPIHRGLIQLELPRETIEQIDRLARAETISRAAWIRRLLIGVARETQRLEERGGKLP
jgi:ribbon-helix-helix CopG family protein